MQPRTRILAAACGALTALLLFSGLASSQNPPQGAVDTSAQLRERFAKPPMEYRTFPFLGQRCDFLAEFLPVVGVGHR